MFDIITVVFKDELETLELQAKSLDLYTQNLDTKCIYVMVNDESQVDITSFGSLQSKVRVVPRNIYGCKWCDNGWVSQQVLKIYGAALSSNTWSIVLDAKSFFVRNLNLTEILKDGKPRVGQLDVYPVFQRSKEIAEDLFKIQLDAQLGPGGVPFVFHNHTVRMMIAEVEQLTGENFAEWFQQQGMLTEFILYSGHIYSLTDHGASLHNLDGMTFPVCHVCHSDSHQYDSKIKKMVFSTSVCIHRRAWENLGSANQEWFKRFINSRGLSL